MVFGEVSPVQFSELKMCIRDRSGTGGAGYSRAAFLCEIYGGMQTLRGS